MMNIFKAMGVGILYTIAGLGVHKLLLACFSIFTSMLNSVGFKAVIAFFGGLLIFMVALVIVFVMGAIPLATNEELKELKKRSRDN